MGFSVNDLLTKPIYDVAFYGQDVVIPLNNDTLALQQMTWSALAGLVQSNDTVAGGDLQIEPHERVFSDVDILGILNQGDGVRFSRSYQWLSDMSAWVYKFDVTFCLALAVTAFTSGNHSVDSVRLRIRELDASGNEIKEIASLVSSTVMGNITSVATRANIVHFEGNTPFKISAGNIVDFNFTFTSTDTDVATTFEGIMPYYFAQEGNLPKALFESGITLHLHPSLDHAFPIFRDEAVQEQLDYSGVDKQGISRSPLAQLTTVGSTTEEGGRTSFERGGVLKTL